MRLKDEELRLVRDEVQSKEQEALLKDNLIKSQGEEISKLKLELEEQVRVTHSRIADVELLRGKNEEKDKYLSNMKITQESSTEELARLEKAKKSLEAQVLALEQNVKQASFEKVALEENVKQVIIEKVALE